MLVLVLLGVFVATVSLCLGAYAFAHGRQLVASEPHRALIGRSLPKTVPLPGSTILRDTSAGELQLLNRLLSRTGLTPRLARELQQAGATTKAGTFVLVLGIGAVSGGLMGSLLGSGLFVPLALVGMALPVVWLKVRQYRRRAAFAEQLPEALDMLANAMRAGYSFRTAMKFVGEEMPSPLGPEFLQFYEEQQLGVEVRAALVKLRERAAASDMMLFVTAVLVHGDPGVNLSEVLCNVADLLRQRADVDRRVGRLIAQSKLSARIVAGFAVVALGVVVTADREFIRPMLAQPSGSLLLAYAAASLLLGYLVLRRIVNVEA